MKKFMFFSLLSFQALACPDLSGVYRNCQRISGYGNAQAPSNGYVIMQEMAGTPEYYINGSLVIADGRLTDSDGYTSITSCDHDSLSVTRHSLTHDSTVLVQMSRQNSSLVVKFALETSTGSYKSTFICE